MVDETKKCPFCGEEIKKEAIKCRYCREWLEEFPQNEISGKKPKKIYISKINSESHQEIQERMEKLETDEVLEKKAQSNSEITNKYLHFWIYVKLTIGAITTLLYAISIPGGRSISIRIIQVLIFLAAVYMLVVASGLHMRRGWAWKLNWGIIFLDLVMLVFNALSASQGYYRRIGVMIGYLIPAILWVWVNTIYFYKRKFLFFLVDKETEKKYEVKHMK